MSMSKVLYYLENGGLLKTSMIARKLTMDEKVVEMIIKQLEQKGYIKTITAVEKKQGDCNPASCSGCSIKSCSSSKYQPKYLLLKKEKKSTNNNNND